MLLLFNLDLSKLLHTWISLSCYMYLSKRIHGFLSVITWIRENRNMDFSKWLRGFIKVVLNAELVKVLIALGPWQCLHLYSPGEKPKYKYNNTGPVLGVVGGSYSSVSLQVVKSSFGL